MQISMGELAQAATAAAAAATPPAPERGILGRMYDTVMESPMKSGAIAALLGAGGALAVHMRSKGSRSNGKRRNG